MKKCEASENCEQEGKYLARNKEFKNKLVCLEHLNIIEPDIYEIQKIIEETERKQR